MTCPKCGANIPDGAKFCEACGAALSEQNNNYYSANSAEADAPAADAPYKPGIKKKNLALSIVLSIVTCGIYGIYWFVSVVNDLNKASEDTNAQSGIVVFLLSLVTCNIYSWYWMYKAGEKVSLVQQKSGNPVNSNNAIIYLLTALFLSWLVPVAIIQYELNKVAD